MPNFFGVDQINDAPEQPATTAFKKRAAPKMNNFARRTRNTQLRKGKDINELEVTNNAQVLLAGMRL